MLYVPRQIFNLHSGPEQSQHYLKTIEMREGWDNPSSAFRMPLDRNLELDRDEQSFVVDIMCLHGVYNV